MKILAIDPGSSQSGYVFFDKATYQVLEFGKITNKLMLKKIDEFNCLTLIEKPDYISLGAGREVIDTIFWCGRFYQYAKGFKYLFGRQELKKEYGLKNDSAVIKFIKENYEVKLSKDAWQAFLLIHNYLQL